MKRSTGIITVATVALSCFSGSYLAARQNDNAAAKLEAFQKELANGRGALVLHGAKFHLGQLDGKKHDEPGDEPNPGDKFLIAVGKGVNDPALAQDMICTEVASYYEAAAGAESAPQASQVADESILQLQVIQTVQNQKIIELLKQIAAKGK